MEKKFSKVLQLLNNRKTTGNNNASLKYQLITNVIGAVLDVIKLKKKVHFFLQNVGIFLKSFIDQF